MAWKDRERQRAYAKEYYEKTKVGRYERIKHNLAAYRKRHKTLSRKRVRDWAKSEAGKAYRERIRPIARDRENKHSEHLTERYLIKQLIKLGHTRSQINENPEIITKYRDHLRALRMIRKTKQLIKAKHGKSTKTN